MLNNWENSQFSIMKKLWDLAQKNLVNIQGSFAILDQYLWMSLSHTLDMAIMAIRVVEFSNGEYKIRKVFAQENLVNILGSHGILDQYSLMSAIP